MSSHIVDLNNAMGGNGATFISDTAAHTPTNLHSTRPLNPTWCAFQAGPLGATISAYSGSMENSSGILTLALPAGYTFYDPSIRSITLSAGTAILYYS